MSIVISTLGVIHFYVDIEHTGLNVCERCLFSVHLHICSCASNIHCMNRRRVQYKVGLLLRTVLQRIL